MNTKAFEIIDTNSQRYIELLKKICMFEARANDKETMDEMMNFVERFALGEGFKATRIPFEKCGDCLLIEINECAEKSYAMMAHMDTVHDKGIFGNPPVKVDGDKITGPGVIDCKGGAVVAMLVLSALKGSGYKKHVRLLLTTDEEVSNVLGGEKELQLIKDTVTGFKAALNCEVGRKGKLVTERSGILRMEIAVKGIGGHSGAAYFESANAILEASHKIIELESMSQKGGTTYNCSLIKGGTVANIVPDNCTFTVDIRMKTADELKEAEKAVHEVAQKCHVKGTSAETKIVSSRPPMVRNDDTMKLFEGFNKISRELGFGELESISTGGGSDTAYTQLAGVPSICSLGPVGDYCHTIKEYVQTATVAERAKLLSAFICKEDL